MKVGYAWHEALLAVDAGSDVQPTQIYKVRVWQWGAALYLLGNLMQFFSYAFAAQTLLLAMSSLQFATHLVAAWLLEGVLVPWRSIVAAAVIIASNVLLVIFCSKSSRLLNAQELIKLHKCASILPPTFLILLQTPLPVTLARHPYLAPIKHRL
jgi:magnesium transporter